MSRKIITIIPTFNRHDFFKRAVCSILDQEVPSHELLILDNGCSDGTKEYLESLAQTTKDHSTKITVFHEKENLGAAKGMHFLIQQALRLGADYIWIMDDDAIADSKAISRLLERDELKNKNTAMLACTIISISGDWSPPNRPARFNAPCFSFTGLTEAEFNEAKNRDHLLEINTTGYCGMFIKKEAFEKIGLPDPNFYLWYDDVDFVLRVTRSMKAYLVPKSIIRHDAQALVTHEKKWPFKSELPNVPFRLMWRYYYLNRNFLWLAKKYLSTPRFAFFWIKHMLRWIATPFVFKQDHIFKRIKIIFSSGFDALFGRLGKKTF